MIDLRFRPVEKWPTQTTGKRKRAVFRSSYTKTLNLLEDELRKLSALDIVIQAGFSLDQIRNDGWPRGGQSPKHPGIILSCRSRGQSLSFPCDTYDTWQDNIHAIALSLNALRAVDRYGVTKGAEQYRGFAQLGAPVAAGTPKSAALVFALFSKIPDVEILSNADSARQAFKAAIKVTHPDRGGRQEDFHMVMQAKDVLEAAMGWQI